MKKENYEVPVPMVLDDKESNGYDVRIFGDWYWFSKNHLTALKKRIDEVLGEETPSEHTADCVELQSIGEKSVFCCQPLKEEGGECTKKKCKVMRTILERENPPMVELIENIKWEEYIKGEGHQEKETERVTQIENKGTPHWSSGVEIKETPKKLPSEICYCGHPKENHKGKDNPGYSYKYNCYHCSCTKFILDETAKL